MQPLLFCFVISAVNVGCKTLEKKPILPCFSSYFWLHFLSFPFEKVLANSSRVDATATICFLHFRCLSQCLSISLSILALALSMSLFSLPISLSLFCSFWLPFSYSLPHSPSISISHCSNVFFCSSAFFFLTFPVHFSSTLLPSPMSIFSARKSLSCDS